MSKRLDFLGICLSVLCVAHCLLLPVVMMALPILARYYLSHPYAHLGLAFTVFPIAIASLWSGYLSHRRWWVFLVGMTGGSFIVFASLTRVTWSQLASLELIMTVVGSVLLIFAHTLNLGSSKICQIPKSQ